MGARAAKHALFAEFAAVGKVLGNPKRLELLDLLAQGPRSVDDLASAIDVARRARLDGPCNVAADGWLDAPAVRALAGAPPRLPLPAPAARALASVSWRFRIAQTPPGLVAYTAAPWAVANDRITAAGWVPTHSNEEAYVAGTPGTPWSRLTPKRRQELALGTTAVVLLGGAGGLLALVRRRRRRR